ncbi:MAG: translesion error-prone DNA polymerase V autoproteolytic subunit [Microscillaceae bacterium]|nr:translesion error-prone DNA polymerase V autoproteolytic subunit [Microscillaceae bacterium]
MPCGFPSPADDFEEADLNFNDLLVKDREATYVVRVEGDSMVNAHILDGDTLVVDKSLLPAHGDIVLVAIDGYFTVKRYCKQKDQLILKAENPRYRDIVLTEFMDVRIFGVVTNVIHHIR